MKKILALVFACLMLIGLTGTALAYDEEITFQGISWGSSFEETVEVLKEKGFINEEYSDYIREVFYEQMGKYLKPHADMTAEIGYDHNEYLSTLQLDKGVMLSDTAAIAGYEVKRLELTFITVGEKSSLINVEINLDYENQKEAFEDLSKKITSIYGEAVHQSFFGVIDTFCWLGNDQSLIDIEKRDDGSFNFYYGTLNAEKMIDEEAENYVAPSNNVDGSNTNGL